MILGYMFVLFDNVSFIGHALSQFMCFDSNFVVVAGYKIPVIENLGATLVRWRDACESLLFANNAFFLYFRINLTL